MMCDFTMAQYIDYLVLLCRYGYYGSAVVVDTLNLMEDFKRNNIEQKRRKDLVLRVEMTN
jgi:hypothetical protein